MRTRGVVVVALLVGASAAAGASVPVSPAAAQEIKCRPMLDDAGMPTVVCTTEDGSEVHWGGGGGGGGGDDEEPRCVDRVYNPDGSDDFLRRHYPDAPEGVIWWWLTCEGSPCPTPLDWSQTVCGGFDAYLSWSEPVEVEPTQGEPGVLLLLRMLWLRVTARLVEPEVSPDPPLGAPATLDVPTFVAVDNWQDGFSESACIDAIATCVEMTATPSLELDPGEPDAGAVPCEPPGTRFDPQGPSPRSQANRPGACAHAYQHRTGSAGRPAAWTAEVRIVWDVRWEATVGDTPGPSGIFDPIPMTTSFDRQVREIQAVVTETDL